MKKIVLFLIISLFIFSCKQQKSDKLIPFESVMIVYKNPLLNSLDTLYYFDYGKTYIKISTLPDNKKIKVIQKDNLIYQIFYDQKIITKKSVLLHTENPNFEEVLKQDTSFKKVGTETILGKKCNVWKSDKSKIWIWNNIILKREIYSKDTTIVAVVKTIKTNISLDSQLLKLPKNFHLIDMTKEEVLDSLMIEQIKLQDSLENAEKK